MLSIEKVDDIQKHVYHVVFLGDSEKNHKKELEVEPCKRNKECLWLFYQYTVHSSGKSQWIRKYINKNFQNGKAKIKNRNKTVQNIWEVWYNFKIYNIHIIGDTKRKSENGAAEISVVIVTRILQNCWQILNHKSSQQSRTEYKKKSTLRHSIS